MHIEPMSATITFNAPGNPTYCVTCLCDLRYPSPSGLWWLVSTHVLPRIRVLCDYGYFAAQVGAAAAGRMVRKRALPSDSAHARKPLVRGIA